MPAQTHFLLINPNSSAHITQRLVASARTALASGDTLQAVTALGEPAVVRDAATLQQAEHNAVALFDAHAGACAAVLLGISLDGAAPLLRLRRPALPVVGMTEAALMSACLRAQRVGLLTLGPALVPLYAARVAQIGLSSRVVGIEAPEAPQAFLPATTGVHPDTLAVLCVAGMRLQAQGAQALVLAGAVLCGGYAAELSVRCGCPVFDGMVCAVHQARGLLGCTR
jgi:Asp/Glu/hydantoin racemase